MTHDRNINVARQGANAISEGLRTADVSAFVSPRDYGLDLSIYFSDGSVELVNVRVQGKT